MSILALALFAAAASGDASVTSATGDWSNIPLVSKRGTMDGTPFVLDRLEEIVRSGDCSLRGASRRRIKMNVPFLIRFDSSGTATEVVVRKLDCPEAESALGSAVKLMAERGEFRPSGTNQTGWYRGAFNVESGIY